MAVLHKNILLAKLKFKKYKLEIKLLMGKLFCTWLSICIIVLKHG